MSSPSAPSLDKKPPTRRSRLRLRRRIRGWRSSRLSFCPSKGLRLLESGDVFFQSLIGHIDAARHAVRLETYMYCDDEAGQGVSAALIRAARRGVDVRVITDGVGTAKLPLFERWPAAGIQHRIFNPHIFGKAGVARDHRKLSVIDRRVAFVGGINIVHDLMHDGHRLDTPRWDFAVELLGPVVRDVALAFDDQWTRVDPDRPVAGGFWRPSRRWVREELTRRQLAMAAWDEPLPEGEGIPASIAEAVVGGMTEASASIQRPPREEGEVAFVARDNRLNRRAIERAYLYAIGHATQRVLLANPYFTPGLRLRRALNRAARRGVDVKLLIGRKEFRLLDWAVPSLYGSMMRAGVKIAEYDKAMLHGKVAVVDDNWATVGSSNLDALSLFLNHEANVVIVDDPVIPAFRASIERAFNDARRINQDRYAARRWPERLLNWAAYSVYRVAMRVLTIGRYD